MKTLLTPDTKPAQHLRAADLRGLAELLTQATLGVARITEGVHQSVWQTLGVPGGAAVGQTRGLTGLVYRSVAGVTQLVGKGAAAALLRLEPLFARLEDEAPGSPRREAFLAVLNGVMGDRLQAWDNPFATPMTLRYRGQPVSAAGLLTPPAAGGQVLLLIHGLCMNDLQWQTGPGQPGIDQGQMLANALGYSPVYLRYNTGLHISQNGQQLALQLEQLLALWPVPLQELTVLAHSMGGLLIRSALYYARQDGLNWPRQLKNIVFLGTPHHGAPLERAGNWVDVILGSTPWTAPFARLGQLRSAGITDLRYGHLLDADWYGHDRFRRKPDRRQPLPLPEGVACFTVAASTAAQRGVLADRLLGDGLVPLHSALGSHDEVRHRLAFAEAAQSIAYRTHHLQLLSSPAVAHQVLKWLTPAQPSG